MKITPAFFRSEPAQRLLNRAAAVSALPLSLHYIARDDNELRIMGWGGCNTCMRVNSTPEGARACRESRAHAAIFALQQDIPVTYLCHLGFTCVSVAALVDNSYLLTFGPYIPSETNQAIAYDVARGLRDIGVAIEADGELPFVLDDVHAAPAGSVSATAEWLVEALRAVAAEYGTEDGELPSDELESSDSAPPLVSKFNSATESNGWILLAALSLACGRLPIARQALADRMEELQASKRAPENVLQAFLTQTVSQLLETARKMGGVTENALNNYPGFVADVREISEPAQMLKAAARVLRRVSVTENKCAPPYLPELTDIVHKHYRDDLKLTEIAEGFGVAASSITRALECRINASFTGYLGQVRIEYAKRLLRNSQLTVTEIGRRVGVNHQSYFGKLFLRYAGMTPGTYRERFQNRLDARATAERRKTRR